MYNNREKSNMTDLDKELMDFISALSREKKQRVYEYAASLKDGPKGNTARCCGSPLARCECEGREE